MKQYDPHGLGREVFITHVQDHIDGKLYADPRSPGERGWDYMQDAYQQGRLDAQNDLRKAFGMPPLEEPA